MAAVLVGKLPEGSEWLYELKLDGYRALLIKDGPRIEIRSRNDKDLTQMYPGFSAAALKLKPDQVVLGVWREYLHPRTMQIPPRPFP
jgi:bifunctional non-homologous end joining protein LigD